MYVEEVLTEQFGRLVAFVKKAETAQKLQGVPENTPVPKYGPVEAAPVVKEFTAKWNSGIDSLHKCVATTMVALVVHTTTTQQGGDEGFQLGGWLWA